MTRAASKARGHTAARRAPSEMYKRNAGMTNVRKGGTGSGNWNGMLQLIRTSDERAGETE